LIGRALYLSTVIGSSDDVSAFWVGQVVFFLTGEDVIRIILEKRSHKGEVDLGVTRGTVR
jgi:hypothetical protein